MMRRKKSRKLKKICKNEAFFASQSLKKGTKNNN